MILNKLGRKLNGKGWWNLQTSDPLGYQVTAIKPDGSQFVFNNVQVIDWHMEGSEVYLYSKTHGNQVSKANFRDHCEKVIIRKAVKIEPAF